MNIKDKYPLFHKNFAGATLSIVPVRIVDIIDDFFIIEYQSGNRNSVKQTDFIEFHKSLKNKDTNTIDLKSKPASEDSDIPF
tara:strand:- start:21 stop:266 length:246 start_codon:yes stop_codon:yes gene_type:complete